MKKLSRRENMWHFGSSSSVSGTHEERESVSVIKRSKIMQKDKNTGCHYHSAAEGHRLYKLRKLREIETKRKQRIDTV